MLQHLPRWLGETMRNMRAGADKIAIARHGSDDRIAPFTLTSAAFGPGGRIPVRYTADGDGISPPLAWSNLPEGTKSLALLVEDPDAPSLQPFVHAIVWGIDPTMGELPEGAIMGDEATAGEPGRNSYLRHGWVPPDPPAGHGKHHYAFQLFALDCLPHPGGVPGRSELIEVMTGHVIGAGLLTGTYQRG